MMFVAGFVAGLLSLLAWHWWTYRRMVKRFNDAEMEAGRRVLERFRGLHIPGARNRR